MVALDCEHVAVAQLLLNVLGRVAEVGEPGNAAARREQVALMAGGKGEPHGLLRVVPGAVPQDADGVSHVTFDLWPAAHRFAAGHRVRVLVASGAHPRYARNPGASCPLRATYSA